MIKKQNLITFLSIISLTSGGAVSAQQINAPILEFNPSRENQSISIPVEPPEVRSIAPNICTPELNASMQQIINSHGGSWGILVQSLATGETIYHYNADRGFIPASNTKILTTAAALQRMEPNATFSGNTSVREWINVVNLRSNNYYADTLLRRVGGSTTAKQILAEMGVNPSAFHFADGSGLSRNNVATPRAIVETLRVMYHDRNRDVFLASLPTAGVSGTLTNRMRQTPVQGIVRAKTGTLRGVRALSGYLDHREHGTLVFSIMANHPTSVGTNLVSGIDQMLIRLNMTGPCR
ncbi:peptidase S13 D-Ala-D-Ala carboxypeptidase C [Cyanobacterium stanieri PCC 7202]|uniref:Peptidase S13 D-Ala-D-Ala carboxypeptidase C n=1 Tax=Cyanobacterium stanieri (strain ATCC 29140 / PCC 7202) TaxID=292563 RepID=K9YIB9_CYASC|nr:peptidase S13 D-Ala-D-Ala carboxypeptidase C [Cyanobacterium stanieri PCC 7202]